MTETQVLLANIISNVVAALILVVAWRWRNVGRLLFVLLFLWAAQINLRTAILTPTAYLDYARWAIPPYRAFILGPFARHITAFVAVIAVGQLAIAVLVALRGAAVRLGVLGALTFLLAIAPLGRGSAFPFSLIAGGAAAVLARGWFARTLWGEAAARLRQRRARPRLMRTS